MSPADEHVKFLLVLFHEKHENLLLLHYEIVIVRIRILVHFLTEILVLMTIIS